jgi:hypothetical protein
MQSREKQLNRVWPCVGAAALLLACGGGSKSAAPTVSARGDAPVLTKLEISVKSPYDSQKDGFLCPGEHMSLTVTGYDSSGQSWDETSFESISFTATPPITIGTGNSGIEISSPLPSSPGYAAQPIKIVSTHKQTKVTAEIEVAQALDCGKPAEIDLAGMDGATGDDGTSGGAGTKGVDGKSVPPALVEAAEVEVAGQRVVLVIATVNGEERVALLPATQETLVLSTSGGNGGKGGRGGSGVANLDARTRTCREGQGGRGGDGGNGGDGADLTVRVPSRALIARFAMTAAGGQSGPAGDGGKTGEPCGARGEAGKPGREGKAAKVITKVVPADQLTTINAFIAKYPTFSLARS